MYNNRGKRKSPSNDFKFSGVFMATNTITYTTINKVMETYNILAEENKS